MQVRQATLEDLSALVPLFDAYRQFYRQASDTSLAEQFLRSRMEHRESVIFLAEDREGVCGFTQLYPSFSSGRAASIFILNDLYVAAHKRRAGVATALISAAEQHARDVGAVRLTLSTALENTTARATY